MSVDVEIDGQHHSLFVRRDSTLLPGEGDLRVIFVPAIKDVVVFPDLKFEGAKTMDQLVDMLGKWLPPLANLKFD